MMRPTAAVAVFALVILAAGCEDASRVSPTATPPSPAPQAVAPPVPAVPLPAPSASDVKPAETAKDSASTAPLSTLTKEEASKSMPMAGHGNSHSSPSLEPAKKQ